IDVLASHQRIKGGSARTRGNLAGTRLSPDRCASPQSAPSAHGGARHAARAIPLGTRAPGRGSCTARLAAYTDTHSNVVVTIAFIQNKAMDGRGRVRESKTFQLIGALSDAAIRDERTHKQTIAQKWRTLDIPTNGDAAM